MDLFNGVVLLELLERVLMRPLGPSLTVILLGSLECGSPPAQLSKSHLLLFTTSATFTELSVYLSPSFSFFSYTHSISVSGAAGCLCQRRGTRLLFILYTC